MAKATPEGATVGLANKICDTCRYAETACERDPCRGCLEVYTLEGRYHPAWEPKNQGTRPPYYPPVAGVDSIRIMEAFNFNLGNAMKYIWRCGQKPGEEPTNDLRKAIQYLEFEIARLERGDDE